MDLTFLKKRVLRCYYALTVVTMVCSCGGDMKLEPDLDGPVRYVLGGERYEVPLGYHYMDSVKRNGRWPTPRDEFNRTEEISITGIIPGVEPYKESTRSEFETLGHGNKINIRISSLVTVYPMGEYLERMKVAGRLQLLHSELDGLIHYWDNMGGSDEERGADIYIKDNEDVYFLLNCPRVNAPSPACEVTKITLGGLQIKYTFSRAHVMSWQSIDDDVGRKIEQFKVRQ